MRKTNVLLSLVLLPVWVLLFSCAEHKTTTRVIHFNQSVVDSLLMSDYIDSLNYIVLETKEDCLLGANPTIYTTDEYIVAVSYGGCYLFDRITGQFVRTIGIQGRGPGEYLYLPSGIIVNEEEKTIVAKSGHNIIEYSLTGKVLRTAPASADLNTSSGDKFACLGADLWVVGLLNPTGGNPNQLVFFSTSNVVDSIANTYHFTMQSNRINLNQNESLFYRYKNNVYYKFLYSDTVFKIDPNRTLQDQWIFESGGSLAELARQRGDVEQLMKESVKNYLVYALIETDGYLFVNTTLQGERHLFLYDKQDGRLVDLGAKGLGNDLCGGPAFWPKSTNNNQDLVAVYPMDQMILLAENQQGLSNVKHSDRLRALVAGRSEQDNPVVLIARLRK